MSATTPWLFIFIVLYALFCLVVAVRAAFENASAAGYFIASRRLPGILLIFGVTATAFSGWVFLGHPGLIFRDGFQFAFTGFYALAIALTGILFFKRQWVLSRRFGYVSPGELFADYFQGRFVSGVAVLISLLFAIPFLGVEFNAAGHVVAVMSGGVVSANVVTWVLAAFVVASVMGGGLRAVAYMSALQGLLIIVGVILLGVLAWKFVGGWEPLQQGLSSLAAHPDLGKWGTNTQGHSAYFALPGAAQMTAGLGREVPVNGLWTGLMCLTYVLSMMGIMASPAFSIWAFSSRSPRAFGAQQVWVCGMLMGLLLLTMVTLQGVVPHLLGANALVNDAGLAVSQIMPERLASELDILPVFFVDALSGSAPWLFGLLAICIIAAIQSSGAAHLHAAGTLVSRDVIGASGERVLSYEKRVLWARLAMLVVIIAALLLPVLSRNLMATLGGIAIASSAQLLPALTAICWMPWFTRQGINAGIVAGLLAVVITDSAGLQLASALGLEPAWGKWPLNIHSAMWGLIFNITVASLVSAVTQSADATRHRMRFHTFLRDYSPGVDRRRLSYPLGWILGLLLLIFGFGPGAMIGNTIFGEPASGTVGWLFGLPSIWVWQILWWLVGVVLLWMLAYRLGLATAPQRRIDALVEDIGEARTRHSR